MLSSVQRTLPGALKNQADRKKAALGHHCVGNAFEIGAAVDDGVELHLAWFVGIDLDDAFWPEPSDRQHQRFR